MAWFTFTEAMTDPDARITSDMAKGWWKNVESLANGESGAPKVQGISLGGVYIGSFSTSATTPATFIDLDRAKTICVDLLADASAGVSLHVAFSNDNGGSWGSNQTVVAGLGADEFLSGKLMLDVETGDYQFLGRYSITGATTPGFRTDSGTLTVPADVNAFRISGSTSSLAVLAGAVFILGGVA